MNTAEAIKSLVRFTGIVLPPETFPKKYFSAIGLNAANSGYPHRYQLYLATFLCHAGIRSIDKFPIKIKNHILTPPEANKLFKVAQLIRGHVSYKSCPKGQEAKEQPYFPDGPMYIGKDVQDTAPEGSVFHQYSAIRGSTYTFDPSVNGVGIWGAAKSKKNRGKAWGGFFTAEGPNDVNQDSQLVGVEVDVVNKSKAGASPNQSKVGIQVVSIGERNSTAALEIISDGRSKWENGLIFDKNSIAPDGAAIAFSQRSPIRAGIDLGAGKFTDAAIRIGNNQVIRFDDATHSDSAATIRNNSRNHLEIVPGRSGLVIRDNKNEKDLLTVDARGNVIFDNTTPVLKSPSGRLYSLSVSDDGKLITSPYER